MTIPTHRALFGAIIGASAAFAADRPPPDACTSLLVTKGASADDSVMITYTCDGEFHPRLEYLPASDHKPGEELNLADWPGYGTGRIKQPPHAYAVIGLMNEHQLAIGETTFDGRPELQNPDGMLHYWTLMRLALQRAKTAREAIGVMADLVEQYGYRDTGESISIGDTNEAWLLEMIGPGKGGKGAIWVAVRVPDGMISCTANKSRIAEFPLDDPENCLYSKNVVSFAIEKGYYDPKSGQPFRFCDAYGPATPQNTHYADSRVWSLLRRAAPSLDLSPDHHRGVAGAKPYPLFVKPDRKLSVADVFSLMRDHYEGTEFDMTKGVGAGPFGTPNRVRPIGWSVDGAPGAWERSISTPQTAFSFVSQSRGALPNAIGGLYWYGLDDTYFSCYVPMYCCVTAVPESFAVGALNQFSLDDAFWVFNLVANYANLRYCDMRQDIQAVQRELEAQSFALQPTIEKAAAELLKTNPELARAYLTDYSVSRGELIVKRYRELAGHLITKYNDGYVQDERGNPQERGYPERWLREVLRSRPGNLPARRPRRARIRQVRRAARRAARAYLTKGTRMTRFASSIVLRSSLAMAQTSQSAPASGPSEAAALYDKAVAAYAAKDYATSIELGLAAIDKGARKGTVPYHLACCYSLTGQTDDAFKWLRLATERGWTNAEHMKSDADLTPLHGDPRWSETVQACEKAADEQYNAYKEPQLARELMRRMAEDQRLRFALQEMFQKQPTSGPIMSKEGMSMSHDMQNVDRDNTKYMKTVVDKYGWPGKSLVGDEAANAAWLLVQHADADPAFQARCLDLIKDAFKNGDATGQQLAYLTDRVLLKQGKKQLYGTQFVGFGDNVKAAPIEDEANLDARRKEVGLSSMADYERLMKGGG